MNRDNPSLSGISKAFLEARRQGRALAQFPGALPSDLDTAYAIQTASIKDWGTPIAGWKIGLVPRSFRAQFGAERLAGPVFADRVERCPDGGHATARFVEGGFGALEAEFIFELQRDPTELQRVIGDEELGACIGALHVGVELAGSPLKTINELGPAAIVSDFGNNSGLIVGPSIPGWRQRALETLRARMLIDGSVAGHGSAADVPEGPLSAVRFLVGSCRDRGFRLPPGTLVSTGAVTGVHEVRSGAQAVIDFGEFGKISINVETKGDAA